MREADFLVLGIDLVDLDANFLADFEHVSRMLDPIPTNLADMQQTIDAANIDERPEIADAAHHALMNLPEGQLGQHFLLRLGLLALEHRPAAENQLLRSGSTSVTTQENFCPTNSSGCSTRPRAIWLIGMKAAQMVDLAFEAPFVVPGDMGFDHDPLGHLRPISDMHRSARDGQFIQPFVGVEPRDDHVDMAPQRRRLERIASTTAPLVRCPADRRTHPRDVGDAPFP